MGEFSLTSTNVKGLFTRAIFFYDLMCDFLLLTDANEWIVMIALMYNYPDLHIRNLSTRSYPSKEENSACKQALR